MNESIGNESGVFTIVPSGLSIDAATGAGVLGLIGGGSTTVAIAQRSTEIP